MSGPALDFDPQAARLPGTGDTREAPTFGEQAAASLRVGGDESATISTARVDNSYSEIVQALAERTGNSANDYTVGWGEYIFQQINPLADRGNWNRDKIWRDILRVRAEDPTAFAELGKTREEFEVGLLSREGRSHRDEELLSRGEGAGSFVAQMAGGIVPAMADVPNIAASAIGVGPGVSAGRAILLEGLLNLGAEGAQIPGVIERRARIGKDTTGEEIALRLGAAFAGGAAIRGGIEAAPVIDAKAQALAKPLRELIDKKFADRDLARAFSRMVPDHMRTPEQEAALQLILRDADIDEGSPFVRTIAAVDAHRAKLEEATAALANSRVAGEADIAAAGSVAPIEAELPVTPRQDFEGVKAAIRGPESAGDDGAINGMGSSAAGRYQFIRSTFISLYRKEYGGSAKAAAKAWDNQRFDVEIQERLMDRLLEENSRTLERAGVAADTGNLYVAHFAGAARAAELAKADPSLPVSQFFTQVEIEQNPTYLGGGRSVGEALATIRSRVGEGGSDSLISGAAVPDTEIRPDALEAERPRVAVDGRAVPVAQVAADDIGVDAELMQFKSGGDEFGVTDRLQGVDEWDPIAAGMVTVWEAQDGRRLIADGHQRLGLAKRIQAQTGQSIGLNAFVLREADGFSAVDARIITALKNIGEGTGTGTDAAKIFRDLGMDAEDVLRRLPPRSALVRDGKALARLDNEAFGAVVNEVIPENYGAAIGALVEDPGLHMAMVRILNETDPPNRVQAEAIIRQAREAGFTSETQDSLFGSEELVTGLFAQRAKILDRGLRELRKMKGAFGVAVRNADTLEAGGNRINVAGSTAAAESNARALALVDKLALRKGNAVNEILDQAARRLAAGEPLARVLKDFVAAVQRLDLDDLAAEAGPARGAGDGAGGSGRPGEPQGQDLDSEQLTPREADAAEAAGETGPSLFDDATAARFDDPAGEGVRETSDSVWHDIRAQDDFAEPTAEQRRRELELKTEGRKKGEAPQKPAGSDGGLFDTQDTTGDLFDLDDGKGARSAADIRGEIDADRAGLEEIRKCLK